MAELEVSTTADEPTVGAASRRWAAELARAGVEGAAGDVRRMIGAALGISAAQVLAEPARVGLPAPIKTLLGCLLERSRS